MRTVLFAFALLLSLTSCSNENGGSVGDPCANDYNQEVLFTNVADNIILPAYRTFRTEVNTLRERTTTFVAAPSTDNLEALRQQFISAWLQWQRVAPFEFGPAESVFLANSLNNFPLDQPAVDNNLAAGSWSFDNPSAFDKGFPALDYLLYGLGDTPEAVVAAFTTDPQAATHLDYLSDVVADIQTRTTQVVDEWENGYRTSFVGNTGTAAGTSLSLIINSLNLHYENLRRDKIGIPAGVLTLGFTNPDKVEAPHSRLSLDLAKAGLEASLRYFQGGSGEGIDDLLNYMDAEKDGGPLANLILDQYALAQSQLNAIDGDLQVAVEQDSDDVQTAYTELQRQIVNLKTDLPSMLCVAITYVDNPSDSD